MASGATAVAWSTSSGASCRIWISSAASTRTDALTLTAGDMSATPAVVVAPEDALSEAARLMHDYDVHHLLVVDTMSRRPVGVVSTLDVAGMIALDAGR